MQTLLVLVRLYSGLIDSRAVWQYDTKTLGSGPVGQCDDRTTSGSRAGDGQ